MVVKINEVLVSFSRRRLIRGGFTKGPGINICSTRIIKGHLYIYILPVPSITKNNSLTINLLYVTFSKMMSAICGTEFSNAMSCGVSKCIYMHLTSTNNHSGFCPYTICTFVYKWLDRSFNSCRTPASRASISTRSQRSIRVKSA